MTGEIMKTQLQNDTLTIFLDGRIDANNASTIEAQIAEALSQNPTAANIQFDAEKLDYISSAGLRVLLKFRKQLKQSLPVLNVSGEVYDIFSVTGFTELLDVRKKLREVSVEGCELVGEGANGKVYRLAKDEMIKVFKYGISLDVIEAEREASRKAFLLGVPCAIAFDTVKCGNAYGTVYEMLNAGTLSERIRSNPERLPELAKAAARLLRKLHAIDVPDGQMPTASRVLHDTIDKLTDFTPEEIAKFHALYNTIPEQKHFVHNDFHPKNVMESNGELMVIDIGEAGSGNPVIDLIHTYFVMKIVGADYTDENNIGFVGLSYREMREFWDIFIVEYCDGDTEKAAALQAQLHPFSVLMYMTTALSHPLMPQNRHKPYVDRLHAEILSRYDELVKVNWDKFSAR